MNLEFILFMLFLLFLCIVIFISKRQNGEEIERELYEEDGFFSTKKYPLALTEHARDRMCERLGIYDYDEMYDKALEAYIYGKSARQADKKTAAEIKRIEKKNEKSVVLFYDGYIYIFSRENVLITVYESA